MTERDGYEHGVPCWVDTWQEDPDTAVTFYAGVFGWEVEKGAPAGTDTRYCMCRLLGSDVAAIGSPPPAGMPPGWTTYVWVDDADAVAASAVKAGGSLLAEPFGSLDGGRMAIVADPSGAVFGVERAVDFVAQLIKHVAGCECHCGIFQAARSGQLDVEFALHPPGAKR